MRGLGKVFLLAVALVALGCAAPGDAPDETGTLRAALNFDGPGHDVTHMDIWLVEGGGDCWDNPAIAGQTVLMEEEMLPEWLASPGGDRHPFSDALFAGLPPAMYKVCAQPLTLDNGELVPTEHCAWTSSEPVPVEPMSTTEIVLVSQCQGDPTGALDAVVMLNDPPHIDDFAIDPSKFITTCEWATLTVDASDPNGDDLFYQWMVADYPPDAEHTLLQTGTSYAVFSTCTPGTYAVQVVVTDPFGAMAGLAVPIHVTLDPYPYDVSVNGAHAASVTTLTGADDVMTFYSYGVPDPASANTGIEQFDTSLIFLYEDAAGAISLVMIHDETQPDGDVGGGQMDVTITGLDDALLAVPRVGDDNPGNDFYTWDGSSTLDVDWQWSQCCTDGLAITFADKFVCVEIAVSHIEGIGAWKVLQGDLAGEIHETPLAVGEGDTIKLCHCLAEPPL